MLLTHLLSFLLPSFHPSPKIIPMASLGVILFFLLSGFLITHTLLAHRDKGLQSYLIDRFCRIYPPYIATLVLVALIDYVYITSFPQQYSEHGYRYTVGRFLTGAFFLPKFNFHTGMAIFGSASQLWTLPVEWWLYLALGIAYYMYHSRSRLLLKWACLLFAMWCPVTYMIQSGISLVWLLGAGCYLLYTRYTPDLADKRVVRSFLVIFLLVGFCFARRYATVQEPYDFLCNFDIAIMFLLVCWLSTGLSFNTGESSWLKRAAGFLASYSYSLYLTHYSILDLIRNYNTSPVTAWVLCNGVAIAFAAIFEAKHKVMAFHTKKWCASRASRRAHRSLDTP